MTTSNPSNTFPIPPIEYQLDQTFKGIPGGTLPFAASAISSQRWNVLREDLPLPLLVLKKSALANNTQVMQRFLEANNISIAPHGKTHMTPQLCKLQLLSGAWAMTVATVSQLQVFRQFGCPRIILANQLVGRQNLNYVVNELNADLNFEFYCLVDSVNSVRYLATGARDFKLRRPIRVLLECGYAGGRTGCRTVEGVTRVLAELRTVQDRIWLAGIEGFEGVITGSSSHDVHAKVERYLKFMRDVLALFRPEDLPEAKSVILSAGGSAYFDIVAKAFQEFGSCLRKHIVLRSGCYLTHDSKMYHDQQEERLARGWQQELFRPALEIWSYVQSIPEPGLAILTMGKRDCPYDHGLPVPLMRYRDGCDGLHLSGCTITALNDQHAYLTFTDADLQFGDIIVCGISHPCTAFDKWRFIPVVNDNYDVIDAIVSFF